MSMQSIITRDKLVLNVDEMSALLGISKPTAYELIKREGFPAVRVSERRIIIPVEGLYRWLESAAAAGIGA